MHVLEDAVADHDVANATADLAAKGNARMAPGHRAIGDHDVLTGDSDVHPLLPFAGFDGDAVVARVEGAVGDQDSVTTVRIDAIGVFSRGKDFQPSNDDVLTVERMNRPAALVGVEYLTLLKHIRKEKKLINSCNSLF